MNIGISLLIFEKNKNIKMTALPRLMSKSVKIVMWKKGGGGGATVIPGGSSIPESRVDSYNWITTFS